MSAAPTPGLAYRRIWDVVAQIPRGRVATYGQVAALAGYPRRARLAGYALFHTPDDRALPWHRVLNAQGRISLPEGSAGHREQKARLQEEGVVFDANRVNLERFGWRRGAPSPLLD